MANFFNFPLGFQGLLLPADVQAVQGSRPVDPALLQQPLRADQGQRVRPARALR